MDNKGIQEGLEAWLTFLTSDDPVRIEELITCFPRFKAMYEDIYELCLNTEKVMQMYSKELRKLDENTVLYMMDELQAERDEARKQAQEAEEKVRKLQEQLRALGVEPV